MIPTNVFPHGLEGEFLSQCGESLSPRRLCHGDVAGFGELRMLRQLDKLSAIESGKPAIVVFLEHREGVFLGVVGQIKPVAVTAGEIHQGM